MKRGKRRTLGGDTSSCREPDYVKDWPRDRPAYLRSSVVQCHPEHGYMRRWGEGRQEEQVGASHRACVPY